MLEYFGLYENYAVSISAFIISFIFLIISKKIIIWNIKKISKKLGKNDYLSEIVNRVHWFFFFIVSVYFSIQFVEIPVIINDIVSYIFIISSVYYAVRILQGISENFIEHVIKDKLEDQHIIGFIQKVVKYTIWLFGFFIAVSNLGYDITALIAGIGIGGIAIAFALQNILSDIFSSITIYFDKPFRVGDFIIVNDTMGTVDKIGIKSTRIKSLTGEEIVMNNKALTEAKISNYRKMEKRRVSFSLGVVYGTPKSKLEKIPSIIQKIIEDTNNIAFGRCHFKEFGDFSLNFETVFFVESGVYLDYMDSIQKINLEIVSAFENENIEMAFPTQTIHMSK